MTQEPQGMTCTSLTLKLSGSLDFALPSSQESRDNRFSGSRLSWQSMTSKDAMLACWPAPLFHWPAPLFHVTSSSLDVKLS